MDKPLCGGEGTWNCHMLTINLRGIEPLVLYLIKKKIKILPNRFNIYYKILTKKKVFCFIYLFCNIDKLSRPDSNWYKPPPKNGVFPIKLQLINITLLFFRKKEEGEKIFGSTNLQFLLCTLIMMIVNGGLGLVYWWGDGWDIVL